MNYQKMMRFINQVTTGLVLASMLLANAPLVLANTNENSQGNGGGNSESPQIRICHYEPAQGGKYTENIVDLKATGQGPIKPSGHSGNENN